MGGLREKQEGRNLTEDRETQRGDVAQGRKKENSDELEWAELEHSDHEQWCWEQWGGGGARQGVARWATRTERERSLDFHKSQLKIPQKGNSSQQLGSSHLIWSTESRFIDFISSDKKVQIKWKYLNVGEEG